LHHSPNKIEGSYIVVFKDNTTDDHLTSFMAVLQKSQGVTFAHTYTFVFKGFAAKLTKTQLLSVRSHPRVEFVEEDQTMYLNQGSCSESTDADWGLCRIARREIDLDGTYFYPHTAGQGVDAYIIDTGIYFQHSDLGGRAIFGFKADSNWPDYDDQGHGTHVASTVGGTKYGVAKNVQLISVKVLDKSGSGSNSGVIAGVNYAVSSKSKRGKPSVGNMSLGGSKSTALNNAVNAASAAGVMMAVAAGNDNGDACLGSPSSATNVICVGATDIGADSQDNQIDVRSYFSNYGTCVDVFAPGSNILGAWIGNPTATRTISGTSMATPHVAGVVALILDQTPSASFSQVRSQIEGTATMGKITMQCANSQCRASPNLLLFNGCE